MNLPFSAGPINLMAAFESVTEHWSPKVVAQVNDQYVKVAKVRGELVWHSHDGEDELFYVVRGNLRIEYEGDRSSICMKAQCMWCLAAFDITRSRTKNAGSF